MTLNGGRQREGVGVCDERRKGLEGGDSSNTKDSGKGSLSLVCVYVQACDAHLWYCDNLLGDEEKTVKTKTGICYLTQQSQWWNKLFIYHNFVLKSFSQSIAKALFRVFLHFEVHFIAK